MRTGRRNRKALPYTRFISFSFLFFSFSRFLLSFDSIFFFISLFYFFSSCLIYFALLPFISATLTVALLFNLGVVAHSQNYIHTGIPFFFCHLFILLCEGLPVGLPDWKFKLGEQLSTKRKGYAMMERVLYKIYK